MPRSGKSGRPGVVPTAAVVDATPPVAGALHDGVGVDGMATGARALLTHPSEFFVTLLAWACIHPVAYLTMPASHCGAVADPAIRTCVTLITMYPTTPISNSLFTRLVIFGSASVYCVPTPSNRIISADHTRMT